MGRIKRWNGSSFVDVNPKKWNGTSWVKANVRRWNGSTWELISEQQYTSTYSATWTRSYYGNDTLNPSFRGVKLCQGRYGNPDIRWEGDMGIQKSSAGFDSSKIRSDLNGASIEKVEVYLHNEHWWYNAGGGRLNIGVHNTNSPTSTWGGETRHGVASEIWTNEGTGKWITLPNYVGTDLRDNKAKGITLYKPTTDLRYYGYFFGENEGSKTPKIRITYKK